MEFYVYKTNGASGIVDAIDIDDAYEIAGAGVLRIEETSPSISNMADIDDDALEEFYSKFLDFENGVKENPINLKVDKLMRFFNNTNKVSAWDKNFVFGVKRSLKNQNKLTQIQTQKLNQMFVKYSV